ncbi:hypothetical protein ACFZDF_30770 [Streptomyces sp. NPDC007910]|uniref:hypothetical protein n=1 Tax=Streptomyces sp. NPDC007910 TaxID=3364790 RepID=UPI0036EA7F3D
MPRQDSPQVLAWKWTDVHRALSGAAAHGDLAAFTAGKELQQVVGREYVAGLGRQGFSGPHGASR